MFSSRDIELIDREIGSVPTTSPRCLVVYPLGKKKKQRLGIGGKDGAVSSFYVGKGKERTTVFTTPPQSRPVSCMALYDDQVFFVYGSKLAAYSRKGRGFFTFDTNVTETPHTLFVSTPFIMMCGNFMVISFCESTELGFYMAPDHINAMVAFVAPSAQGRSPLTFSDYRCIIGCSDRVVRMLSDNKLLSELSCEAAISALCVREAQNAVYYGTEAGSLGCLNFAKSSALMTRVFSYIPSEAQPPVTALVVRDINSDSREEMVVGRLDGCVQVFLVDKEEEREVTPVCIWAGSVDGRVLTIETGYVTQSSMLDIVVHSFSGKVTAFTVREVQRTLEEEPAPVEEAEDTVGTQIESLQTEIEELRRELISATRELAACTGQAEVEAAEAAAAPVLAVSSTFTSRCTISQQVESPVLLLTVEADTPLDSIVVRSDARLHFLRSTGVVVIDDECAVESSPDLATSAILRPPREQMYSCSVRFWVEDGRLGTVKLIVMAAPSPRTAQVKILPLRLLPLFARVGDSGDDGDGTGATVSSTIPSALEVEGEFTARDMHSWLFRMLPGTPSLYRENQAVLRYDNVFLHDTIRVEYGDKRATLSTGSLVALCIMRYFLVNCGVERSLEVRAVVRLCGDAVHSELRRIATYVAANSKAIHDAQLLEAIREMRCDCEGGDMDFLLDEYKHLLSDYEAVANRNSQALQNREYLLWYVLQLYNSASDLLPRFPKMTPATREALATVCNRVDAVPLLTELQRLFSH